MTNKNKEERKHSKFSASAAERWLQCPASVELSEKAPPKKSSKYAEEGTTAHTILEVLIKAYIEKKSRSAIAKKLNLKFPPDDVMVDHAQMALDWIIEQSPKAQIISEKKVHLPVAEPEVFGTLDVAIIREFSTLSVVDYKYGQGVAVSPIENPQLIFYALGLAHEYDYNFSDTELVVIQPRAIDENENGPVKSWKMPVDDLFKWRDKFEAAIENANSKNPTLKTGPWCKWCQARPICPALSSQALEQAKLDFAPSTGLITPKDFIGMTPTPQELSRHLDAFEKIEMWMESVREHAQHRLEKGEKIPGWKLVQKRSTRKWLDEKRTMKEAIHIYGEEVALEPQVLRSPAQLEKAIGVGGKEWVDARSSSVSSGTTMVRENDARPEVIPIEQEFSDLPNSKEVKKLGTLQTDNSTKKRRNR